MDANRQNYYNALQALQSQQQFSPGFGSHALQSQQQFSPGFGSYQYVQSDVHNHSPYSPGISIIRSQTIVRHRLSSSISNHPSAWKAGHTPPSGGYTYMTYPQQLYGSPHLMSCDPQGMANQIPTTVESHHLADINMFHQDYSYTNVVTQDTQSLPFISAEFKKCMTFSSDDHQSMTQLQDMSGNAVSQQKVTSENKHDKGSVAATNNIDDVIPSTCQSIPIYEIKNQFLDSKAVQNSVLLQHALNYIAKEKAAHHVDVKSPESDIISSSQPENCSKRNKQNRAASQGRGGLETNNLCQDSESVLDLSRNKNRDNDSECMSSTTVDTGVDSDFCSIMHQQSLPILPGNISTDNINNTYSELMQSIAEKVNDGNVNSSSDRRLLKDDLKINNDDVVVKVRKSIEKKLGNGKYTPVPQVPPNTEGRLRKSEYIENLDKSVVNCDIINRSISSELESKTKKNKSERLKQSTSSQTVGCKTKSSNKKGGVKNELETQNEKKKQTMYKDCEDKNVCLTNESVTVKGQHKAPARNVRQILSEFESCVSTENSHSKDTRLKDGRSKVLDKNIGTTPANDTAGYTKERRSREESSNSRTSISDKHLDLKVKPDDHVVRKYMIPCLGEMYVVTVDKNGEVKSEKKRKKVHKSVKERSREVSSVAESLMNRDHSYHQEMSGLDILSEVASCISKANREEDRFHCKTAKRLFQNLDNEALKDTKNRTETKNVKPRKATTKRESTKSEKSKLGKETTRKERKVKTSVTRNNDQKSMTECSKSKAHIRKPLGDHNYAKNDENISHLKKLLQLKERKEDETDQDLPKLTSRRSRQKNSDLHRSTDQEGSLSKTKYKTKVKSHGQNASRLPFIEVNQNLPHKKSSALVQLPKVSISQSVSNSENSEKDMPLPILKVTSMAPVSAVTKTIQCSKTLADNCFRVPLKEMCPNLSAILSTVSQGTSQQKTNVPQTSHFLSQQIRENMLSAAVASAIALQQPNKIMMSTSNVLPQQSARIISKSSNCLSMPMRANVSITSDCLSYPASSKFLIQSSDAHITNASNSTSQQLAINLSTASTQSQSKQLSGNMSAASTFPTSTSGANMLKTSNFQTQLIEANSPSQQSSLNMEVATELDPYTYRDYPRDVVAYEDLSLFSNGSQLCKSNINSANKVLPLVEPTVKNLNPITNISVPGFNQKRESMTDIQNMRLSQSNFRQMVYDKKLVPSNPEPQSKKELITKPYLPVYTNLKPHWTCGRNLLTHLDTSVFKSTHHSSSTLSTEPFLYTNVKPFMTSTTSLCTSPIPCVLEKNNLKTYGLKSLPTNGNKNVPGGDTMGKCFTSIQNEALDLRVPIGIEHSGRQQTPTGLEHNGREKNGRVQTSTGIEHNSREQTPTGLENNDREQTLAALEHNSREQTSLGLEHNTIEQTPTELEHNSREQTPAALEHNSREQTPAALEHNSREQTPAALEHNSRERILAGKEHNGREKIPTGLEHNSRKQILAGIEHNGREQMPARLEHSSREQINLFNNDSVELTSGDCMETGKSAEINYENVVNMFPHLSKTAKRRQRRRENKRKRELLSEFNRVCVTDGEDEYKMARVEDIKPSSNSADGNKDQAISDTETTSSHLVDRQDAIDSDGNNLNVAIVTDGDVLCNVNNNNKAKMELITEHKKSEIVEEEHVSSTRDTGMLNDMAKTLNSCVIEKNGNVQDNTRTLESEKNCLSTLGFPSLPNNNNEKRDISDPTCPFLDNSIVKIHGQLQNEPETASLDYSGAGRDEETIIYCEESDTSTAETVDYYREDDGENPVCMKYSLQSLDVDMGDQINTKVSSPLRIDPELSIDNVSPFKDFDDDNIADTDFSSNFHHTDFDNILGYPDSLLSSNYFDEDQNDIPFHSSPIFTKTWHDAPDSCSKFKVDNLLYHPIALPMGYYSDDADESDDNIDHQDENGEIASIAQIMLKKAHKSPHEKTQTFCQWVLYRLDEVKKPCHWQWLTQLEDEKWKTFEESGQMSPTLQKYVTTIKTLRCLKDRKYKRKNEVQIQQQSCNSKCTQGFSDLNKDSLKTKTPIISENTTSELRKVTYSSALQDIKDKCQQTVTGQNAHKKYPEFRSKLPESATSKLQDVIPENRTKFTNTKITLNKQTNDGHVSGSFPATRESVISGTVLCEVTGMFVNIEEDSDIINHDSFNPEKLTDDFSRKRADKSLNGISESHQADIRKIPEKSCECKIVNDNKESTVPVFHTNNKPVPHEALISETTKFTVNKQGSTVSIAATIQPTGTATKNIICSKENTVSDIRTDSAIAITKVMTRTTTKVSGTRSSCKESSVAEIGIPVLEAVTKFVKDAKMLFSEARASMPNKVTSVLTDKATSLPNKGKLVLADKATSLPNKRTPVLADKATSLPNKRTPVLADKATSLPNKGTPVLTDKEALLSNKETPVLADKPTPLSNKETPVSADKPTPLPNKGTLVSADKATSLSNKGTPVLADKPTPLPNKGTPVLADKPTPLSNKETPVLADKPTPLPNKRTPVLTEKATSLPNKGTPVLTDKEALLSNKETPVLADKPTPLSNKETPVSADKPTPLPNKGTPVSADKATSGTPVLADKPTPLPNKGTPVLADKPTPLSNKETPVLADKPTPLPNKGTPVSADKPTSLPNKGTPVSEDKATSMSNKPAQSVLDKTSSFSDKGTLTTGHEAIADKLNKNECEKQNPGVSVQDARTHQSSSVKCLNESLKYETMDKAPGTPEIPVVKSANTKRSPPLTKSTEASLKCDSNKGTLILVKPMATVTPLMKPLDTNGTSPMIRPSETIKSATKSPVAKGKPFSVKPLAKVSPVKSLEAIGKSLSTECVTMEIAQSATCSNKPETSPSAKCEETIRTTSIETLATRTSNTSTDKPSLATDTLAAKYEETPHSEERLTMGTSVKAMETPRSTSNQSSVLDTDVPGYTKAAMIDELNSLSGISVENTRNCDQISTKVSVLSITEKTMVVSEVPISQGKPEVDNMSVTSLTNNMAFSTENNNQCVKTDICVTKCQPEESHVKREEIEILTKDDKKKEMMKNSSDDTISKKVIQINSVPGSKAIYNSDENVLQVETAGICNTRDRGGGKQLNCEMMNKTKDGSETELYKNEEYTMEIRAKRKTVNLLDKLSQEAQEYIGCSIDEKLNQVRPKKLPKHLQADSANHRKELLISYRGKGYHRDSDNGQESKTQTSTNGQTSSYDTQSINMNSRCCQTEYDAVQSNSPNGPTGELVGQKRKTKDEKLSPGIEDKTCKANVNKEKSKNKCTTSNGKEDSEETVHGEIERKLKNGKNGQNYTKETMENCNDTSENENMRDVNKKDGNKNTKDITKKSKCNDEIINRESKKKSKHINEEEKVTPCKENSKDKESVEISNAQELKLLNIYNTECVDGNSGSSVSKNGDISQTMVTTDHVTKKRGRKRKNDKTNSNLKAVKKSKAQRVIRTKKVKNNVSKSDLDRSIETGSEFNTTETKATKMLKLNSNENTGPSTETSNDEEVITKKCIMQTLNKEQSINHDSKPSKDSAVSVETMPSHNPNVTMELKFSHGCDVTMAPKSPHDSNVAMELNSSHDSNVAMEVNSSHVSNVAMEVKSFHDSDVTMEPQSSHDSDVTIGPKTSNDSGATIELKSSHDFNVTKVSSHDSDDQHLAATIDSTPMKTGDSWNITSMRSCKVVLKRTRVSPRRFKEFYMGKSLRMHREREDMAVKTRKVLPSKLKYMGKKFNMVKNTESKLSKSTNKETNKVRKKGDITQSAVTKTTTGNIVTKATTGNVKFRIVTDRTEQVKIKRNKKLLCKFCKQRIPKCNLMSHAQSQHPWRCVTCTKVFDSRAARKLHYTEYHTGDELHTCMICRINFRYLRTMERHRKSHVHKQLARLQTDIIGLIRGCLCQYNIPSISNQAQTQEKLSGTSFLPLTAGNAPLLENKTGTVSTISSAIDSDEVKVQTDNEDRNNQELISKTAADVVPVNSANVSMNSCTTNPDTFMVTLKRKLSNGKEVTIKNFLHYEPGLREVIQDLEFCLGSVQQSRFRGMMADYMPGVPFDSVETIIDQINVVHNMSAGQGPSYLQGNMGAGTGTPYLHGNMALPYSQCPPAILSVPFNQSESSRNDSNSIGCLQSEGYNITENKLSSTDDLSSLNLSQINDFDMTYDASNETNLTTINTSDIGLQQENLSGLDPLLSTTEQVLTNGMDCTMKTCDKEPSPYEWLTRNLQDIEDDTLIPDFLLSPLKGLEEDSYGKSQRLQIDQIEADMPSTQKILLDISGNIKGDNPVQEYPSETFSLHGNSSNTGSSNLDLQHTYSMDVVNNVRNSNLDILPPPNLEGDGNKNMDPLQVTTMSAIQQEYDQISKDIENDVLSYCDL